MNLPYGVRVAPNGELFVTNLLGGMHFVATINLPSRGYGIAVDSLRQRIYVALPNVDEVAVYSTVPPYKPLPLIK